MHVYYTCGETVKMNILDLLSAASLENNFAKKLSCARFVNEVKTTGAQTHCWHVVCEAVLVFSGEGKWTKGCGGNNKSALS